MPPGRKYLLKTVLGPSGVHFRPQTYQWLTKSGDREGRVHLLITRIITDRIRRHEVLLYLSKKKK